MTTTEAPTSRRSPKPPRAPKAPRPPKRPPRPPVVLAPLTTRQAFARSFAAVAAALLIMFALNLLVFSHVQHLVAQQRLSDDYRAQLEAGIAPVSEGDFEDVLLADGAPVGLLAIPSLGLHEVIVEGTASGVLTAGIGHRRDTVLPGQGGVSVLMGRAAAYGGPFSHLQSLAPGDVITVRTGQGLQEFAVIGLRYAGDPTPPAPKAGESRLILQTSRGAPYVPTGVAYVDAELTSDVQPAGARMTTTATLPASDTALGTDVSTVWALVFAVQFLIAAEIAAVWSLRRIGSQKTWIVFVPVLLLAGFFVADEITRLLPNML
ncbi:sortase [Microbacterium terricola]|uniref:Sortase n=1 Tax=Microbacterium terricola TaxID=344163 RepID=A0ABM8E2N2_9MICO|nr:class E sortase [Microbacterium terricola]UYK40080.1 class E sortase [Microbacterium terricola]BDV32223.1 sortase [Microbacterium terricola]